MKWQYILRDPFAYVIIFLIFATLSWTVSFLESDATPILQGIQNDYKEGLAAKTASTRKEAFNRSLDSLLSLEQAYNPVSGNGNLYQHIADNYFQLQEYPRAILYYYRALNLRPNDATIKERLGLAQKQLNINQPLSESIFKSLFFWHTMFSVPHKWQLFALFTILSIAAASAYLWLKKRWLYQSLIALATCSGIMLASLAISNFFTPSEAVIIKSTSIYRDAGEQFATVMDSPIPSGTKVQILAEYNIGTWLKIETPQGIVGFVPYESLQMI